ncbi:MAG TPA: hypothetical protein VHN14_27660 [Kofleriaceae bacterium]|nr:hypothetical protein [Kofleriaceae bacterium]
MSLKRPIVLLVIPAIDSQVDGNHNGTTSARLGDTVQNIRIQGIGSIKVATLRGDRSGAPDFLTNDLLPSATDLETPLRVDLVDELDELDVPNWT